MSEGEERQGQMQFEPLVELRGTRNYVHSTDLYPLLLEGARRLGCTVVDGPLEIKIRRLLRTQPRLVYGSAPAAEAAVAFRLTTTDGELLGWATESGREVTARKPYDEARIWDRAVLEDRTIRLREPTGMAAIEVVTALGVLQHRMLFPPTDGRKWLLGRIGLARPLAAGDVDGLRITLARSVGRSMTRSILVTSSENLGSMEFMLGRA